jgi:hypothetical protein
MTLRRLSVALFVVAVAALVSALPAASKDGVTATLTTNVALDAEPGTELWVAWTLAYPEDGRRRPFGASGVFVRLVSASGAVARTVFAPEDRGRYAATVVVPEGGIGDIEIGLRGWVSGATGSRRSDLLFPITNDPLPGSARIAAPPADPVTLERGDSGSRIWVFVVMAGLLVAISAASLAVARRLTPRDPMSPP